MNTFLIVLCILICLFVVFALYRYLKVSGQNKKLNKQRFDRIKPLYEKLEAGQAVDLQDILPFAESVATRELSSESPSILMGRVIMCTMKFLNTG